jgi:cation diffusion facilitator family transporter
MSDHHAAAAAPQPHDHVFLGRSHARNERRTFVVIAITTAMMIAEIAAGTFFGSMALLADGWHMATHAAALLITALAYVFACRHARDSRFTFGTGKVGDLAAFASAVVLALVALLIGWESLARLVEPQPIGFDQAIAVACIGLVVNVVCALLLKEDHGHGGHHHHHHHHGADHHHDHDHAHGHEHGHGHGHAGEDQNLRAAYLHVLADALTSLLAIIALLAGRAFGWVWLDPVIGMLGAAIIARWSWGLMRMSGATLVDFVDEKAELPGRIRRVLEREGDRITDLHVWQVGPGHHSAIVSLRTARPQAPSHYRKLLGSIPSLSHLTVEVEQA